MKEDWEFERSSGYAGYRNKITSEWIYEKEYLENFAEKENKINSKSLKEGDVLFDILFGEVKVVNIRDIKTDNFCKVYEQLECEAKFGSGKILFKYSIDGYQGQFTKLPRLYISNPLITK